MTRRRAALAGAMVVLLLSAHPVHAYLDPTAGSMMLQLALGGLAGLGIALKLMWRRILALLGRGGTPPAQTAASREPGTPRGV